MEYVHCYEEIKVVNILLCFLVCLHFPLAVTTVVAFLDLRRVSSSPERKSFLLSMCIDAPESITNSRSSGFSKRVPALPRLRQESTTFLFLPF